MEENKAIEKLIEEEIKPHANKYFEKPNPNSHLMLRIGFERLMEIEYHYARKENVFFPFLEKHGITAPPKVMWGVDDEIRAELKEVKQILSENIVDEEKLNKKLNNLISKVKEMIFKEENILLPMILETFTQDEWIKIALDSKEIGYMIDQVPVWNPTKEYKKELKKEVKEGIKEGIVTLPSGVFKVDELVSVLNTLPFDITFVDKD